MLKENLKSFRQAKGFTQEELAVRLHVVRQTVSKWEKGMSVPDADMLIQIADILEVNVNELLGSQIKENADAATVAEQLSRINEQLAVKNRRARRIWKTIAAAAVILAVLLLLFMILSISSFTLARTSYSTTQQAEEQIIDPGA